jgi:hypothetical protein
MLQKRATCIIDSTKSNKQKNKKEIIVVESNTNGKVIRIIREKIFFQNKANDISQFTTY